MIAWIIGIVTLILLVFIFWRKASKTFRERVEEPKYRFLENLGIPSPDEKSPAQTHTSQEEKNGSAQP